MKKTVFLLLFLYLFQPCIGQEITISTDQKMQSLEGWGVSLCWWAHMCGTWSEENIDTLIDWLVSPNGLNFNIFRYNIGGGDDPQNRHCEAHHMGKGKGIRAEMPGFKAYPNSPYNWQADSAQIKILLKIKEKRPDAIFEAFSNSAPWYMTESGCCAGNAQAEKDNLRPECYEDFAQYLVDVCQHFQKVYGITFRTLEPFNESHSNYWYQNGSQEGCHFDTKSQIAFLKVLYPILKKSGLSTQIAASDETSTFHSLSVFEGYKDVLPFLCQWNVHTYSATSEERQLLHQKVTEQNLRLWQSESGSGGKGISGNLKMLQRLFDDLRDLQPIAWLDWQYVEEKGDQWSMVRGNFQTQEFQRVKNYFIRQQVSRFIPAGSTILQVDDPQTLAALTPDGKTIVLATLNNTSEEKEITYLLPTQIGDLTCYTTSEKEDLKERKQTLNSQKLPITLAPYSVKTFLLPLP